MPVYIACLASASTGRSVGSMLTVTTLKSLPMSMRDRLQAAIEPVEHLRAKHRAVVIDQRQNHRLAAEVLRQLDGLRRARREMSDRAESRRSASGRCRLPSAVPGARRCLCSGIGELAAARGQPRNASASTAAIAAPASNVRDRIGWRCSLCLSHSVLALFRFGALFIRSGSASAR